MELRHACSPKETALMNTIELRKNYLIQNLVEANKINLCYTLHDRMIVGVANATSKVLVLQNPEELKAEYFLERREIGIINIGGDGIVVADGKEYSLQKLDCLYLGKETKDIKFKSLAKNKAAIFYFLSVPAHHKYPSKLMSKKNATPVHLGEQSTSNKRTIYKYIHLDGIKSCQLVMGLTILAEGCVWNSVPPHTHARRMEVYYYFDLPENQRVMHFMGEPQETRHLVMANNEAVISPPWSVHFGSGTSNYGFVWGMAGENQEFTDMDAAPITAIK